MPAQVGSRFRGNDDVMLTVTPAEAGVYAPLPRATNPCCPFPFDFPQGERTGSGRRDRDNTSKSQGLSKAAMKNALSVIEAKAAIQETQARHQAICEGHPMPHPPFALREIEGERTRLP